MQLAISVKNLDSQVNYINPTQKFDFSNEYIDSGKVENFLVNTFQKEVMKLKKKEQKKLFKVMQTTNYSLMSFLAITPQAMATSGDILMPVDVVDIFKYLIAIAVVISLGMAMLIGLWTGIYGMFGKKAADKAKKWRSEIIKALVQGLAIIPIVALVWFLYVKLFGDLQWFTVPF